MGRRAIFRLSYPRFVRQIKGGLWIKLHAGIGQNCARRRKQLVQDDQWRQNSYFAAVGHGRRQSGQIQNFQNYSDFQLGSYHRGLREA